MSQSPFKVVTLVFSVAALLAALGGVFASSLAGMPREQAARPADAKAGDRPAPLRRVTVQDFEKDSSLPKVWVVGIPNESATVELSTDHPSEGKRCLKLHYHFTGGGWPVDLSRYNGLADMYVDCVRVYEQAP